MFSAAKTSAPSGSYSLSRSLRLRSSATAYLNRAPGSAGNRQKFTISVWVKRGKLGTSTPLFSAGTSSSTEDRFMFAGGDTFLFDGYSSGSTVFNLNTTAVYRDPSAWYHFVAAVDTTQSTASNRILLYVNGVQVTSFGTSTYPTQNASLNINNNIAHYIGTTPDPYYADDYLTEYNFIDGQALTPTSFGAYNSTTGVWQPIKYTGTYGTNGFYLNFNNNASTTTLGYDTSGNGNNWTTNNISLTAGSTYDSMTDVPTLTSATAANYCVINPLDKGSSATLDNGNLRLNNNYTGTPYHSARASVGVSSGKWYWEVNCTTISGNSPSVGVASALASMTNYLGADAYGWGYVLSTGAKGNNGNTATAYGASVASGDVVGVALDMDAGTLTFYKNNTSQGQAFSGLSGVLFPAAFAFNTSVLDHNFGQRPFSYTPPTGFVALNTYNLPTPTIVNGASYMAATTYTGTGAAQNILNSNNTTTGVSFKPDFVWVKSRSSSSYSHRLFDVLRGTNVDLQSNTTNGDTSEANSLTAFNSNGYSVGVDSAGGGVNTNAVTYIGWQWQAGAGSSSSNTNGSITSTVSVNATAGFSVVTYTGNSTANATVGHGLGVSPSMVFIKSRSSSNSWIITGTSFPGQFLNLDGTQQAVTSSTYSSTYTSTTFSLKGTDAYTNYTGYNYVAYCWAQVAGFSKFGSYTGNGSTDGPFVYTGFRPRYIMIKRTDNVGDWWILDTSRDNYNVMNNELFADTSGAEAGGNAGGTIDFLSNGFKLRCTTQPNTSSGTFVYACFAENPFRNSLAR